MKELIVNALAGELKDHLTYYAVEKSVETPPSDDLGDYAFPCFALSKLLRKNPAQIAAELKEKLGGGFADNGITVKSTGGYLNFFVDKKQMAAAVLEHSMAGGFGRGGAEGRVVVEFASPNTNKPLHLGHLRNMSIGDSVARILAYCGCEVVRVSINNDRGVHICKSMLAYKRCGGGAAPESANVKSDRFVGDYYVMFNGKSAGDPSWNDDAQKMLRDWEDGDPETLELWKKMNGWALSGFRETYKLFGIAFDKEYYESDIYKNGKEIVRDGLDRGIFHTKENGAVAVNLTEEKLGGEDGDKVLLRPDGTSVYIVQDLYLALLKDEEFRYDRSFYVVGNEQDYHFAVLIAIFKKLGYGVADKMKHLSYGMVELPEGKMKSREGTVVDADDLILETKNLAKKEVVERYTGLSDAEAEDRSLKIALAAIKYQLLKIDISKNMIFDPKKAISFEGDTGPYLLYSYARASSIIRKAGGAKDAAVPTRLEPAEVRLVKKISFFTSAIKYARDRLSPSVIAVYAFELAQTFNEFYHANQVIGSGGDVEAFRVSLVASFRATIEKCLGLLGIEPIEEM
ncbi:MAG: arginine--tRNA ligase [Chitinispirillia bacterium]|nr:arginine--tRNA ligase [Chitinispirillia bacterium]MCL2242745.1 arginine--tRNA ligase [Chitinispirillia bacterium]